MDGDEGVDVPQGYIDEEEHNLLESPSDPQERDNERGFSESDLAIAMKVDTFIIGYILNNINLCF